MGLFFLFFGIGASLAIAYWIIRCIPVLFTLLYYVCVLFVQGITGFIRGVRQGLVSKR